MKKIILFVSLCMAFGFCFGNSVSSDQNPILFDRASVSESGARAPSWTIMVYLDGDNNLEGAGIDDFLEMSSIGSTADVNIVVQFDRISGYDSTYDDWTSTKRFYITPGMTPTIANALMDLGEANMGDPTTLVDFVNWAKANYPAPNYALILWDHGDGWRKSKEELWRERGEKKELIFKAVCWDDTNGGDCLYMAEVKSALRATGGADLIGFDACLMGMAEVAFKIWKYGQVMVGSEETEPWDGWPYNTIMSDLTTNPSWTPSQLGTAIVDRYYASYGNSETQSAIDLTNMDTLAGTINTFARTMIDYWDSNQTAVRNAAQDVMTEIDNTVINEQHGTTWPGAHGLAIYFPETSGGFDPAYNGARWEEFLQEFYSSMGGSWIADARAVSQEFFYTAHIDLYHFCYLLNVVPGDYYTESQITHEYVGEGTAQGLQDDDWYTTYSLPFDFSYFGETIPSGSTIYISTNGYVDFDSSSSHTDFSNSTSELASNKRIAPCWDDLRTDGSAQPGEDVYITENVDNLVIRWAAETYGYSQPVNVELVLYQNGCIQFNYNGGNTSMTPTIGISKGDSTNKYLSVYDGQSTLTNVDSDLFTPILSIRVISPNGGENWLIGSTENIIWDAVGASGKFVKIILLKANGTPIKIIANNVDAALGSYAVKIPARVPERSYKIKIKIIGIAVSDESDAPFTVSSPE